MTRIRRGTIERSVRLCCLFNPSLLNPSLPNPSLLNPPHPSPLLPFPSPLSPSLLSPFLYRRGPISCFLRHPPFPCLTPHLYLAFPLSRLSLFLSPLSRASPPAMMEPAPPPELSLRGPRRTPFLPPPPLLPPSSLLPPSPPLSSLGVFPSPPRRRRRPIHPCAAPLPPSATSHQVVASSHGGAVTAPTIPVPLIWIGLRRTPT
mmetsp:Transcript_5412/g.10141  ORF Transcript_5412/g.10141 Transcript_5412/m.10141 type:complete len:204 (+) Transcript_5412:76-687(+)